MKRYASVTALLFTIACFAASARAQDAPKTGDSRESAGLKIPETDRLRIAVRFLAGYGGDKSEESLGLENQGRVGYAIVRLSGKLSDRFSWLLEVNPVHETEPLPSCGEARYFYPNTPQAFGPNVACDNNGRVRVDDYRFIALDTINQQGPIRQAYLEWAASPRLRPGQPGGRPSVAGADSGQTGGHSSTGSTDRGVGASQAPFAARFGRFVLPIGFGVEEAGSFTAKDATHIQRINAEANFGAMLTARRSRRGQPMLEGNVAAFLGDGNRFHDYDYYYSLDASLDTNSALTALVSGRLLPFPGVEARAAYKWGYTGSKVEVLPNFYASKRNDRALVLSARYARSMHALSLRVLGEYASYTWGPTDTSADMLGLPRGAVIKDGYYAGGDVGYQVTRRMRVGVNATREELSRDDSLIRFLAVQGLYDVALGKKERSTVWRFYADIGRMVTIGFYRNTLDNPFPWVSGIVPIEGPNAFGAWGRGNDKWGVVVRFRLE